MNEPPHSTLTIRMAVGDESELARRWYHGGREATPPTLSTQEWEDASNVIWFVAVRGETLVGAVQGRVLAGQPAAILVPQLAHRESESTSDTLLAAVCDYVFGAGGSMAQALINPRDAVGRHRLRKAGFQTVTAVAFLLATESSLPSTLPASQLHYVPVGRQRDQILRFLDVLTATYEDTLDCPELDRASPTAGHDAADRLEAQMTAESSESPARACFFVQHDGKDVGCLRISAHSATSDGELHYMGLVPAARGNGWGREMTAFAQWWTGQQGVNRLFAECDIRNVFAMRCYQNTGFVEFDRRDLLWIFLT